jgi:predicted ester cyclase
MSEIERNKQIIAAIEGAWDSGNLDTLDQHFAPSFSSHSAVPGLPAGLAGAKIAHGMSITAFPDRKVTIEAIYAERDRVSVRTRLTGTNEGGLPWLGAPPNGKKVNFSSISIYRLEDGRVVEHWGQNDIGLLMAQLGVAGPTG